MKIVLASESFYPNISGVSVSTFLLAKSLIKVGHEVAVFAPSADLHNHREQFADLKKLTVYRFRSFPNPFRAGFRISLLPKRHASHLINTIKPDIVHLQDPTSICSATLSAAKRLNIPVVITNHFTLDYVLAYLWFIEPIKPLVRRRLLRYLTAFYNQCDAVITPTETVAATLRGWGLKRPITAISNGVALEHFFAYSPPTAIYHKYHLPAHKPIVLYIGRLDRDKSMHILMDAIPKIRAVVDAHFVFVGGGNFVKKFERQVRKARLGEHVTFVGQIYHETDDLPALYQIGTVFVIPSTIETQSIVTLEAMAAGLPVVAARAGALVELVKPNQNGLLFEPGNSSDLAAQVVKILNNPALAKQFGQQSLLAVSKHRIEMVHKRFETIYEKAIAQKTN